MIYLELQEVGFFELFKQVILPLALVFLLEMVFGGIMLRISKESVPELQDDLREIDGMNEFFEYVIWLGSTEMLLLFLSVTFMFIDKASAMYLWASTFTIYFLMNILASLYKEQRLYLLSSDVKSNLCYTGFGNPSYEVATNFFLHVSLFLHSIESDSRTFRKRPLMRKIVHVVWPTVVLAFLFSYMFALVALGANSFNQVTFGALLGFTVALIANYWVKHYFIDLQERLTKKQIAEAENGDEVI